MEEFIAIQIGWRGFGLTAVEAVDWDQALEKNDRSDCTTHLFTREEAEKLLSMLLACLRPKLRDLLDRLADTVEAALDYREDVSVVDALNELEKYIYERGGVKWQDNSQI